MSDDETRTDAEIDETADPKTAGAARLAQAALLSPEPPAEAEAQSREELLAQWPEPSVPSRPLHGVPPMPGTVAGEVKRLWNKLRGRG